MKFNGMLELFEQSATKTFKYIENIKEKQTKPRKLNPKVFHNLLIKENCPFGTKLPSRETRVAKNGSFGELSLSNLSFNCMLERKNSW